MRILFVDDVPENFVSGSGNFYKRLGKSLATRGHTVAIACPGKTMRSHTYRKDVFTVFGLPSIPVYIQKDFRVAPSLFLTSHLQQIFDEFKPDVIHIQVHWGICSAAVRVARERNIPIIGTNHFLPENVVHFLPIPHFTKQLLAKALWKQMHKVFSQADAVTTPTQIAADALKKTGFTRDITPVSCGIDMSIFNPENNGNYLIEKYHIPAVPKILYVSRLDPEKSVDTLIQAMPLVLAHTPAHLIIAGRGTEEARLKKMTHALGIEKNVTFTGFLPNEDLPNIYRIADCFVMPSGVELQSIATMEAMASGLPIVAADAMALPELVHNGANGFLFTYRDPKSLVQKAVSILTDTDIALRMSQESLSLIKKHDIIHSTVWFESTYSKAIDMHLSAT